MGTKIKFVTCRRSFLPSSSPPSRPSLLLYPRSRLPTSSLTSWQSAPPASPPAPAPPPAPPPAPAPRKPAPVLSAALRTLGKNMCKAAANTKDPAKCRKAIEGAFESNCGVKCDDPTVVIIIVIVVVVLLLGVGVFCYCRRKNANKGAGN